MSLGPQTVTIDFDNKKEIGQDGKNSRVFLSLDKQLNCDIVVKEVKKSDFINIADYFAEAQLLEKSSHRNVVQIKFGGEDADNIYFALPYYQKGSLKNLIDTRFLTVREILKYSIEFLQGLSHIHSKGLIHFDIKPDNILISDANEALLSDFGISKNVNYSGIAEASKIYGKQTPPEAFSKIAHTIAYDIYTTGVTIYRLCNGNKKFYDDYARISVNQNVYKDAVIKAKFPKRNGYLPHIPIGLKRILNKAMNVDEDYRQKSVLELINSLSNINDLLDWEYSEPASNHFWLLDKPEKKLEVTATLNGTNYEIQTIKTMKDTGNSSRVGAGCVKAVSAINFNKTVQDILLNLER